VNRCFEVDGNKLVAHLAVPTTPRQTGHFGVVIVHGFPAQIAGGVDATVSLPELADQIAEQQGWVAMAYASRGVGNSEGDFSLGGWLRDLQGAVTYLRESASVTSVYLLGFGTGGALAVVAAASDPTIQGVAAVAASADFDDWARNPRKLLVVARDLGLIRSQDFPPNLDRWAAEFGQVRAIEAAERLADRELLVLHGSEDETVPLFDARAVADSHGTADLRVVQGAGHQLRHDPRAMAVLFGWLERQRSMVLASDR